MYRLAIKLKILKTRLKDSSRQHFKDISSRVQNLRKEVTLIQQLLDDPTNHELADMERAWVQALVDMRLNEEELYRQKFRVQWLSTGDQNSKFFHLHIKVRENRKHILSLTAADGTEINGMELLHLMI